MSAKRSRLGRSSSSGNTSVLSAATSIFDSTEVRWSASRPPRLNPPPASPVVTSPETNRPPAILTISSPVRDPAVDVRRNSGDQQQQFGKFLEKCHYCRKRIAEDDEVFMYSDLRAFCTAECREKQIDIDKDLLKLDAAPKTKGANSQKDHFGTRSGKRAGP